MLFIYTQRTTMVLRFPIIFETNQSIILRGKPRIVFKYLIFSFIYLYFNSSNFFLISPNFSTSFPSLIPTNKKNFTNNLNIKILLAGLTRYINIYQIYLTGLKIRIQNLLLTNPIFMHIIKLNSIERILGSKK